MLRGYLLLNGKRVRNSKYSIGLNVTPCDKNLTHNLFGNSVLNSLGPTAALRRSSPALAIGYYKGPSVGLSMERSTSQLCPCYFKNISKQTGR